MSSPKILTHPGAEEACLGACLLDVKAARLVAEVIRPEDWSKDRYRRVHDAVRRLLSRGDPVDRLTLWTEISKRPHDGIDASWLVGLEEAVPSAANVREYIALVRSAALRQQVRDACLRTAATMGNSDASVPEVVRALQEDIENYVAGEEDPSARACIPVKLGEAIAAWERSCDKEPEARVKTPFSTLTYHLDGGFGPGELIYLGAPPSTGKSAFALEVARAAGQQGIGTLIVSREMVIRSLVRRIVAQAVRIPARVVKRGTLTTEQWGLYAVARDELCALPVWLLDQAMRLSQIVRVVDRWAFTPRLGLVIVDYLQLVQGNAKDRRQEVDEVSQGLKGLAVRHGLPVLALSSLSRPSEEQAKKRPSLRRLKESGNLEHDADTVLFLFKEKEDAEETECIIAKQRDGARGTVYLRFRPEFVAFEQAQDNSEPA